MQFRSNLIHINSLENLGEQQVIICLKLSIHVFIYSLNKDMLITYYACKHHMLGTTYLRPLQSINLLYIPRISVTFIFPHLQKRKTFEGLSSYR